MRLCRGQQPGQSEALSGVLTHARIALVLAVGCRCKGEPEELLREPIERLPSELGRLVGVSSVVVTGNDHLIEEGVRPVYAVHVNHCLIGTEVQTAALTALPNTEGPKDNGQVTIHIGNTTTTTVNRSCSWGALTHSEAGGQ